MIESQSRISLIIFLFISCIIISHDCFRNGQTSSEDDDFYNLLKVERSATSRDIRKSFKKLALKLHPDKNPGDKAAHDKFIKINEAYEILKDDELRKKYDMYGKEGLKDDAHNRGNNYQTWDFYNSKFGIYDDDEDIVTLTRADFEAAVKNSDTIWFINYYSAHCGHCHELAPFWRELAAAVEGVVRIGAVNCLDDNPLCNQEGIEMYPSLIMYPSKQFYKGETDTNSLINFVMSFVTAKFYELHNGSWKNMIKKIVTINRPHHLPWIIISCMHDEDCLEDITLKKIASALDGFVHVASVNCHLEEELCQTFQMKNLVNYFQHENILGFVEKKEGKLTNSLSFTALDYKEIVQKCLELLPNLNDLTIEQYKDIRINLKTKKEKAHLLYFTTNDEDSLEFRKIPSLLKEHSLQISSIDCRHLYEVCKEFRITKYPSFLLLKDENQFQFHYGRQMAHDIVNFARDNVNSPCISISTEVRKLITKENPIWFVDFFAPWCPPCMQLIPQFRRAAQNIKSLYREQVKFGTVDCTVNSAICNKYSIRSYPSLMFFNGSETTHYSGQLNEQDILDFIEDMFNPVVVKLNEQSLKELVEERKDELWLVDYYNPNCRPCQDLIPVWRRLAKAMKGQAQFASVDCLKHPQICQRQSIHHYPNIRLYNSNDVGLSKYVVYNGWFRDFHNLRTWIFEYLPSETEYIDGLDFHERILKSTDVWLVDFFAPWCGHCQQFAPEFEEIARKLKGRVRCAKINCDNFPVICRKANIRAYPTVMLYKGRKDKKAQAYSGEEINSLSAEYIHYYVEDILQTMKQHDEL
ncbi:hypothetical protein SNEBB_008379 [Seison nebaliae]|nr:hypothetical protein SNEBB_008379 [Seison nebaliae]